MERKQDAELTPPQRNVLEAIVEGSLKTKGPRAGEQKALVPGDSYDGRTLAALDRRDLIRFKIGTIHGTGYVATPAGLALWLTWHAPRPAERKRRTMKA